MKTKKRNPRTYSKIKRVCIVVCRLLSIDPFSLPIPFFLPFVCFSLFEYILMIGRSGFILVEIYLISKTVANKGRPLER